MSVSACAYTAISSGAAAGPSVSPSTNPVQNFRASGTCFAGVQYNSSGVEFASTNAGAFTTSRGNWLDSGNASDVWFERIINSGSLNWFDPGAGRHNLATTRTIGLQQASQGINIANVTVRFWDAASGGTQLGSATFDLRAEQGIA